MKDVELLENGKLLFHSYEALKTYCDNPENLLDLVVLGKEITALCTEDKVGYIHGLFEWSDRTNEQFAGIENWDVSNVKDMSYMFSAAVSFNQPIDNWDVSNVKDMSYMFSGAGSFNQPIDNWDVSNVESMSDIFGGAKTFNQPLEKWDVSNVEDMSGMFRGAESFN